MKKLCLMGAFLFSIFAAQNAYSQDCCGAPCDTGCNQGCDERTGECICKYVHWQACPYTIQRCYTETIPCQRTCCRMVPQYFPIQKCRMVPEYYTVQGCRYVPEYYQVPYNRYVQRTYCEPHCRYIPQYYWKRECCGASGAANSGACGINGACGGCEAPCGC